MSILKFNARIIFSEKNKEDKYYMVGLADDQYDYKNYIILQKAFKFDIHDIESGMDGPYFEVNGQENSAYKCCQKVILNQDAIEFHLNAIQINNIEKITINISSVNIDESFLKYLKEILGNTLEETK